MAERADFTPPPWRPTATAPAGFPCHLVAGELILADGEILRLPERRDLAAGWGARGPVRIAGPDRPAPPVGLRLGWFSYLEDRFWRCVVDLPEEPIAALLAEGLVEPRTGERVGCDALIVGVAPGGGASVWLAAAGATVEVAAARGEPDELAFSVVSGREETDRASFIAQTLERLLGPERAGAALAAGAPDGLWDRLRRRFAWTPSLRGGGRAEALRIDAFNGEREPFLVAGAFPPRARRGVPKTIRADWTAPDGAPIGALWRLEEAEAYDACDAVSEGDATAAMRLDLRIDPDGRDLVATLRTARRAHRFRRGDLKVFRRR